MAKKRKFKFPAKSFLIVLLLVLFGGAVYYFIDHQPTDPNTLRVYFLKGDKLFAAQRKVLPESNRLKKAGEFLIEGPNAGEKAQGIFSELPEGTRIIKIRSQDSTAFVDFNSALEKDGGGAARIQAMVGQIVYTFTDLAGIDQVKILVNGRSEVVLGGEGLVIDSPLSRADVKL